MVAFRESRSKPARTLAREPPPGLPSGSRRVRSSPAVDLDARHGFRVRFLVVQRGPSAVNADMPASTLSELKKLLLAEGFEVYRTLSDRVVLADRVRDNLIMDSGVSARIGPEPRVHFVVRAQGSDFPTESAPEIFERARLLARDAMTRNYREVGANSVDVHDPGDRSQTLDVWHEVAFEKTLASDSELLSELRYAFSLEKTAAR